MDVCTGLGNTSMCSSAVTAKRAAFKKLPRKTFSWFLEENLHRSSGQGSRKPTTSRELKYMVLSEWNVMTQEDKKKWAEDYLQRRPDRLPLMKHGDGIGREAVRITSYSEDVDFEMVTAPTAREDTEFGDEEPRNNLYWHSHTRRVYVQVGYSPMDKKILLLLPILPYGEGTSSEKVEEIAPREITFTELQPLEEECIDLIPNSDTADFVEAMFDFAEWDDHSRVSVRWPSFILSLLRHPTRCFKWRAAAESHPLSPQFPTKSRLYLFFLCCEHLGALSLLGHDAEALRSTLSPMYIDVLDSVLFFIDNQCREYRRSFSRCGVDYQADIPDMLLPLCHYSTEEQKSGDIVFESDVLIDDELVKYTAAAKAMVLQELYKPGLLLETVRNVNVLYSNVTNSLQLPTTGEAWRVLRRRKVLSLCVLQSVDRPLEEETERICDNVDSATPNVLDPEAIADLPRESFEAFEVAEAPETSSEQLLRSDMLDLCPPRLLDASVITSRSSSAPIQRAWHQETPAATPSLEWKARVSDGNQRWSIPFSAIRIHSTCFETLALSFLHVHGYDTKAALADIGNLLGTPHPHCDSDLRIRPTDFETILSVCDKTVDDMYTVFKDVSHKTSQSQAFTGVTPLSMKKLINVYYSKYAARERDEKDISDVDFFPGGTLHSRLSADMAVHHRKRSREDDSKYGEGRIIDSKNNNQKRAKGSPGFNRWPAGLPIMRNNLYWIKNSESPCVCLGLELPGGAAASGGSGRDTAVPLIKIFPINCSAPMRQVSVLPTTIEPLDINILTKCHDARTVDFTLAMMKFAEWEMSSNPEIGRRWYSFPSFIMQLISHSTEWSTWRKQVLRSVKGRMSVPKGILFFESLVSDYENFYRLTDYDRCIDADVPWDDSLIVVETTTRFLDHFDSSTAEITSDSLKGDADMLVELPESGVSSGTDATIKIATKEKAESKFKTLVKVSKEPKHDKEQKASKKKVVVAHRKPVNTTSLYWLTRHSLPCIRLECESHSGDSKTDPEIGKSKDPEENFKGQPICCSTYHYEVHVSGAVEKLTQENLKLCTDERTIDFTNALLDFQHWDLDYRRCSETYSHTDMSAKSGPVRDISKLTDVLVREDDERAADGSSEIADDKIGAVDKADTVIATTRTLSGDNILRYQWPEFILHLITHPREWAVWRKKCERLVSVKNKRTGRRYQYFEALREQQVCINSNTSTDRGGGQCATEGNGDDISSTSCDGTGISKKGGAAPDSLQTLHHAR